MSVAHALRWGLVIVCLAACSKTKYPGGLAIAGIPATVMVDEDFTVNVTAFDAAKQTLSSYDGTVKFESSDRAAPLPGDYPFSENDQGRRDFVAAFRTAGRQSLTVKDPKREWTATQANIEVKELSYTDPPAGTGKIRLVRDTSSPGMVLKLVAAVDVKGYAVGFDLPLQQRTITTAPELLNAGDALNLGQAPFAIGAAVGERGPLAGVLVTGVSQKAAGPGASLADAEIKAGQTFYSFRVKPTAVHTTGVLFDGAALDPRFRAALRNRLGQDVVSSADFAIGRLEVK